jgi:RNA polymerase-binding transcription factor DksA
MAMKNTKQTSGGVTWAADPIATDAHRTRERLKMMERQNPIRERAHAGDNTPWADSLEELHDDMAKNEFLAARELLVARLKALSRAEEKVKEGTYGLCDSCSKPISVGRLQAVPGAVHCVRCAERLERDDAAGRQRLWLGDYQLAAA